MSAAWQAAWRRARARAQRAGRPVVLAWRRELAEPPGLLDLFDAAEARGETRFFAASPEDGCTLLAIGSRCELVASSGAPLPELRERAHALLRGADPNAVLVGGAAFAPRSEATREPRWREFPNARFTLPERLYVQRDGRSWLTHMAVVRPRDAQPPEMHEGSLARSASAEVIAPSELARADETRGEVSERAYGEAAAEAIARIRHGDAQKVVLARCEDLAPQAQPRGAAVLRSLRTRQPGAFVFAQGFGSDVFLGATPERLLRKRGREVCASAVAGTTAPGAKHANDLWRSPKEREEHAFVVRALEASLGELCSTLDVPPTPSLLETGNVQHLHTPIRGRLRRPTHVLDLVSRLHPTPAVAGTPRNAALDLIRKHEPFDRGWYAGPLGWLDAAGDGDFIVALRCGVIGAGTARLFAGAGLVASSDPIRETAETTLKLNALREALESACTG
ncbi:MAG: isochorismate synthase MenF [Myxococcota bacterium]